MHLSLPVGSTSKIIQVPVFDSSSTIGALLAGLVYNTASLTAYYNREGAAGAATAITLATATKGTWATGGFIAIDGTNTPGWYELHIPDAALASGAKSVVIHLKGAANMVPVPILIELTATSNQDAVRGGMTSLPASGTLAVNPTLAAVTHTGAVIPTVTTLTGHTAQTGDNFARLGAPAGASVSADVAATKVDTAAIKVKTDFLPSIIAGGAGGLFIAGSNAATSITTALTANITGNLSGSVGSVTGAVGSVTSGVTVTTNNDKTGYTASTVSDKTGYSLTQAFPTNFADLAITVTTGRVTAGTVSDKTGYSLTQTFPTNFASMSITAGGLMDINLAQTISAQTGAPTTVGGSLYFNRQAIKNKLNYAKGTDTMILYEDDGTTAKFTFTMVDDASSATRGAGT